jgi:hypothetical protein
MLSVASMQVKRHAYEKIAPPAGYEQVKGSPETQLKELLYNILDPSLWC